MVLLQLHIHSRLTNHSLHIVIMEDGIKIFGDIDISNDITLSYGTVSSVFFGNDNPYRFKRNAFVPQEPWREILPDEKRILTPSEADCGIFSDSIAVVTLSPDAQEFFAGLPFDVIKSRKDLFYFWETNVDVYRKAAFHLSQFINPFKLGPDIGDTVLFHVNEPGQKWVTIDYKQNKRVGLHVDQWDLNRPDHTDKSSNRITLNLGRSNRYLLFINLTVGRIMQIICERTEHNMEFTDISSVINYFFNYYPDYPVLRLCLKPYQAYIAPTENMIHDGSTFDSTFPDVTFMSRGYYWLKK